jgi:methylmalonyl-CoA/ethylmalonyl-CoA epimerase
MKLHHHIGYLVTDIQAARNEFSILGFVPDGNIIYDEARDVQICFMRQGESVIELVCPASLQSPIAPMLKKYRNMPYHLCFEADNFDEADKRYTPVKPQQPAIAFGGRQVAFYMSSEIGLIELLMNN